MKKIQDLSQHFDHEPHETGNYLDAAFCLKKFLRFDGDRYRIVDNRQLSDCLWEFTVKSADGTEDKYICSHDGYVRHESKIAGN